MTLTTENLKDTREWQLKNYHSARQSVVTSLEHTLGEIKREIADREAQVVEEHVEGVGPAAAFGELVVEGPGRRGVQIAVFGLANLHLDTLARSACDIDATERSIRAITALKETLPPELVEAIEQVEAGVYGAEVAEREAEDAARAEKEANRCQEQTYHAGAFGSCQCSRGGTKTGNDGKLYCSQHVKKHLA